MGKKTKALVRAGTQFVDYATQHYAKTPPQLEKGDVNIEMATMCFDAADSKRPKYPVRPDFRPVESDSGVLATGGGLYTPKSLLRTVYDAVEAEKPLKALSLQPDDRIILDTFVAVGFAAVDELSDAVTVTTLGRTWIGIRPEGLIDLPVEVAEVTGNIAESELAARYMEGKMAAIDKSINGHDAPLYSMTMNWSECYQHIALVLKAAADEFRQGLHLPPQVIEGKVIPYNEDRSTGIQHADSLRLFFTDVYGRNLKAGWWTDIETGQPKKRSVGELFILFITEIAEAYMAYRDDLPDDKLPEYPGLGVELADLGIRWADFCGALLAGNIVEHSGVRNPGDAMFIEILEIAQRYESIRKTPEAKGQPEQGDHLPAADVAIMVDRKLDFNAHREDHKIENRLKEDGKRT